MKILLTSLLVGILVYLGCTLEGRMLYYPDKSIPSEQTLSSAGLRFWPSGRDGYRGFASTAAVPASRGTIVVFHGNAGAASDRDYYLSTLAPLGFQVLLAEYPGYGGRPGKPGEKALIRDAHETLMMVSKQYGGPLYVLGESLGCGVVAAAAKNSPVPIDGIILITPWDSLRSVAKHHFPWLPVGLFLRDAFDSIGNLKVYDGPVAVVGAERDEVVPLRHAQALFDTLRTRKKMWTVAGAGHNDWSLRVTPAWWKEIADFIRSDTVAKRPAGGNQHTR